MRNWSKEELEIITSNTKRTFWTKTIQKINILLELINLSNRILSARENRGHILIRILSMTKGLTQVLEPTP